MFKFPFRVQRYVEYPKLPNLFAEKSQSTLSEFSNSQIGFPLRAAELNLLDHKIYSRRQGIVSVLYLDWTFRTTFPFSRPARRMTKA